ncbi:Mucin-1 [Lasiodiplodia theobromae]|uniref:Mucin-1 n=1 Tax=Lasiodiplodia theobromae TaxID=45133 RepID=UPI0015C3A3D0|nr:Mucin-1 [Lasiodiplodia theobromae]KAF4543079.1 Mucin-1 [Lasiodiplodia theobromae]
MMSESWPNHNIVHSFQLIYNVRLVLDNLGPHHHNLNFGKYDGVRLLHGAINFAFDWDNFCDHGIDGYTDKHNINFNTDKYVVWLNIYKYMVLKNYYNRNGFCVDPNWRIYLHVVNRDKHTIHFNKYVVWFNSYKHMVLKNDCNRNGFSVDPDHVEHFDFCHYWGHHHLDCHYIHIQYHIDQQCYLNRYCNHRHVHVNRHLYVHRYFDIHRNLHVHRNLKHCERYNLKYRNTDHVDRINTEWTKFYDQYNQCYFNYLNIFDHEHLERINFHFNNICEIFNRHIHQLEYRNTDYIDRINTKWTDFYEQYN